MSEFYGRHCNVEIILSNGTSINVGEGLHVTFHIEKYFMSYQQIGEVTIYNLNESTEANILNNAKEITISAGYGDGLFGEIFRGRVFQPLRGKVDSTTFFITLRCIDGDDALNLAFCSFTLANGQTAQKMAKLVARNSSVPFDINIDPNLSPQETSRGKVFFGQPKDYLRSIAVNNNAGFYTDKGIPNIRKILSPDLPPPSEVIALNAGSGMIGIPVQVEKGIKVQSLINPNIGIFTWLKLNNQDINAAALPFGKISRQALLDLDGLYKVIVMQINGDTRGQNWYMDMECVSQKGSLADLLTNLDSTGY